ncbi:MAG TPA: FecR family protein [Candidatus Bilamarchaeaceae archaeon]|nr:FecR family protein [Candidatus Bilamarchaeaceae archaeon]
MHLIATASIFLIFLFSPSFAGEFLCGGVGGIPCTTDCQGHWSEVSQSYISCECPQGEPCICYCPAGGGGPQAGVGEAPTRPTTADSFLDNAPACQETITDTCLECGVVNSVSGKVGIKRNGEWCLAYYDLAIQPGDTVYCPEGSKIRIMYVTGEKMDVGPNSSFIFEGMDLSPAPGATRELILKMVRGAYNHMFESDRIEQFEIRMDSAVVGIVGTEFIVEATDSHTKVKVLEGKVDFRRQGSDSRVLINEGEYSVLYSGASAPSAPQQFNVAGESRWWRSLEGGSCCGTAFMLMIPLLAFAFWQ